MRYCGFVPLSDVSEWRLVDWESECCVADVVFEDGEEGWEVGFYCWTDGAGWDAIG